MKEMFFAEREREGERKVYLISCARRQRAFLFSGLACFQFSELVVVYVYKESRIKFICIQAIVSSFISKSEADYFPVGFTFCFNNSRKTKIILKIVKV